MTSGYGTELSVIDAATNKVIAGVKLPSGGDGLAVSPDGNHIYVTDAMNDEVLDINALSYKIETAIKLPSGPDGVSITPDGNFLYTANHGNSVSIIDTRNDKLLKTITAGSYPVSMGNFITPVLACYASPVSFTITVNPTFPPAILTTVATGTIFSYAGKASSSPNIQKFTISGSNLKAYITAIAPSNFQISTNPASGYSNVLDIRQSGGILKNTIIYVRSSLSAVVGSISSKVILSSAGAVSQTVAVNGIVHALTPVNPVANQTVVNGASTTAVSFGGAGCVYKWTNSNPAIGLPASGTGDIASFTAVNTGTTPVTATITAVPQSSGGFAYIPNSGSGTVSVIRTSTNTVVATVNVGSGPGPLVISNYTSKVYIVNKISKSISVISTVTNLVEQTIPIANSYNDIVITPDGNHLFVSDPLNNEVLELNATTGIIEQSYTVGNNPNGLYISSDGTSVGVANEGDNTVSLLNTYSHQVFAPVAVGVRPDFISGGYGGQLNVSNSGIPGSISVISTVGNTVVSTINVGASPFETISSPSGDFLYVANTASGTISVIASYKNQLIATINLPAGFVPYGLSLTQDFGFLYVTGLNSNNVVVINTQGNSIVATIQVGMQPDPVGNFLIPAGICNGTALTFTITVNPSPPSSITTNTASGSISSCAGIASSSPNIQQFTLSGSNLTADITATAPSNFEISTNAASGYDNSLTVQQSGGTLNNTVIYVRSSSSATAGNIAGNVILSSAGVASQTVAVNGFINALPTVNQVANQTVINGAATAAINFTGIADSYTWVNDMPGIGLAASGTGDIPVFTASNTGKTQLIANITVTPQSGKGCSGFPVTFTIAVTPTPPPSIDFNATAFTSLNTTYGTPSASTNFTLSAVNLRAGVLITPPPGFEISTDKVNYSNTITVGAAGTLATTTIYIRLAATTGVGSYAGNVEVVSAQAYLPNFDMDESTVTPAILKLTASNIDKGYGTTLTGGPGPLAFSTTGLKNSENIGTVTVNYGAGALATDPVNTYPGSVVISSATGGTFNPANYIINYVPGDIIITPAPLLATVDNKSKVFGAVNPVFTITYSGFVNNENESVFTTQPVITTTALTNSPAGQYPITAGGAVAQNYTFTYMPGILTITAPAQEIIIPNTFTPNGDGINDLWYIKYLNLYPKCTVNVYTRYGEKVYSSVGYGVSWDGTFKGAQLPTGTYYYVIDPKSDIKIMAGYITIIR